MKSVCCHTKSQIIIYTPTSYFKLISDADMVKITAHFKRILSLTSYRDHSRCKIVNSCANFLDLKMISVIKPLVYFGKKNCREY